MALFFILLSHGAAALNPETSLVELLHTSWTAKSGAPAGGIRQVAQTSDGFLWMSSNVGIGLYRFDGHFEHIELPRSSRLSSMNVYSIFAPKLGGLWIGFTFGGAAFLQNGHFTIYNERDGLPSGSVKDFAQDPDGTVWVATTRGLAFLGPSGWLAVASLDGAVTDPEGLFFDTEGTLWIACAGRILFLPKGAKALQEIHEHFDFPSLVEAPSGVIWVGDINGIRAVRKVSNPNRRAVYSTQHMLIDRDGSIWGVRSQKGVMRITRPPETPGNELIPWTQSFGAREGLTSRFVKSTMLEDREGSVWVGTSVGLDRFSNRNLIREFDLPALEVGIAAADGGGIWIGAPRAESVWRLEGGKLAPRAPALNISCLLRADDGSIWFGGEKGIWHYMKDWSDRVPLPITAEGQQVQAMAADQSGALWVSIVRRGVFRWLHGNWSENGGLRELPKATAITVSKDTGGRLWLGYTDNRIAVVDGRVVRLYSASDGITIGNVTAIYGGRSGLWVGGEFGLALFDGQHFRKVVARPPFRLETITGIVETPDNDVWLNSNNGIAHIAASEIRSLLAGQETLVRGETFDAADGLEGVGSVLRPHPTAVEGTDGKLWFATNVAVFSLDPKHLIRNSVVPPVAITSLHVGETAYTPADGLQLPAHSTALRINYVALSLAMPEKIRYRYKLDGVDSDWQDAEGRTEAYFVNITPGRYRFRVIASNNDGVWNNNGATLNFVIPPTFAQTPWFWVACLVAGSTVIWLAFRFRMRQIAARMRLRLNERLRERERIARELHDTLLQSTQGLMLRVQAARNRILPDDPAREVLDGALKRADEVMAEARDRVQDLREPLDGRADIAHSLCAIGDELALGRAVSFRVILEGSPAKIKSKIVDDAYNIGREALLNAFHHAQATSIEIVIAYSAKDLRLQVCDNGCGIDSDILEAGSREGHWGLKGMRERAQEIGALLKIRSRPGGGTEIELLIPSAFASRRQFMGFSWWPFAQRVTDL